MRSSFSSARRSRRRFRRGGRSWPWSPPSSATVCPTRSICRPPRPWNRPCGKRVDSGHHRRAQRHGQGRNQRGRNGSVGGGALGQGAQMQPARFCHRGRARGNGRHDRGGDPVGGASGRHSADGNRGNRGSPSRPAHGRLRRSVGVGPQPGGGGLLGREIDPRPSPDPGNPRDPGCARHRIRNR